MADRQFVLGGIESAPADWVLPASLEIIPKTAYAAFDGTNAAGPFLPCLEIVSDSGHVVGYYPVADEVAAGASVVVSWFPGADVDQDGGASSGGGTIQSVASPTSTILVGEPSGPAVTVDLPATGVVAGTYGDALTVPQVTVDAEGRLDTVAGVPIASGAGGGIVQVSRVSRTSGDLTTSSTTFVDATGLTTTITTGAHRCLVIFSGNAHVSGAGSSANAAFDLAIDGTRQGQGFGLTIAQQSGSADGPNIPVGFTYLTDALSAGSHTFKIQWRVDAQTGTLFASTGVTPAILTVLELGV